MTLMQVMRVGLRHDWSIGGFDCPMGGLHNVAPWGTSSMDGLACRKCHKTWVPKGPDLVPTHEVAKYEEVLHLAASRCEEDNSEWLDPGEHCAARGRCFVCWEWALAIIEGRLTPEESGAYHEDRD